MNLARSLSILTESMKRLISDDCKLIRHYTKSFLILSYYEISWSERRHCAQSYDSSIIFYCFSVEGKLLYSAVLVSAIPQGESAITIHRSPSSIASQTSRSSEEPGWAPCMMPWRPTTCLSYTWWFVSVDAILCTRPTPSLTVSTSLSSTLCLQSSPANRFIGTILLDSMYRR